jgi:hypothetical protein
MAVTQLTINDAMKRIRVWKSDEAVSLREQRHEAETKLAMIGPASLAKALEMSRLREQIERLRSDSAAARPVEPARVATDLARNKLQVRELERKLDGKRDKLTKLRIQLAESEALPEPDGTDLRLPDPRPAPLGAESVVLFCRYERVLYPNLARLEKDFFGVVRRARGPTAEYFRSHDVGNADLRWQLLETPSGQVAQLDWRRPQAGETLDELRAPGSDLRRALAGYDPKAHFIRFYVWADSFEEYLAARRIVEDMGFAVGWEAYEVGQSLRFARSLSSAPTPVD